jgi:thiosulfate/3-mercaptopyruvate sulfurtransferase
MMVGALLIADWTPLLAQVNRPSQKDADEPAAALPTILVTADWLVEKIARGDIALADVRDREAYLGGHIRRAVSLPPTELAELSDPGPGLGRLGLLPEQKIICYGNSSTWLEVARLFWLLELAGCRKVMILEGGIEAWLKAGYKLESEAVKFEPKQWQAVPDSNCVATKQQIREHYGRAGCEIIDARASGFGQIAAVMSTPGSAWRKGHIPHALPVDFLVWLQEDGSPLPPQKLRKLAGEIGPRPRTFVDLGSEFIVYDDGETGAGLRGYLMLRLAGVNPVRYFPGGWPEWSADESLPTVRITTVAEVSQQLQSDAAAFESDVPQQNTVLLDLRHGIDYRANHIPGAVHIMSTDCEDSLETILSRHWPGIDRAHTVAVTYCYGPECIRSRIGATSLARHGFLQVEWLREGIRAWRKAGEKTVRSIRRSSG